MRERLYAPGALLFGPGAGCPNATDLARGRRPGTPAHLKFQLGSGQLARHIGLPWRSAAGSASNTNDMQAAQETLMGLWGGLLSGATMMVHAAGWLEGGLSFGYEKFINDVEALQMLAELCTRPGATPGDLAADALAEVPPGGHFFASAHTMDRYDTAFYPPLLSDLRNFGSWTEAGSQGSDQRAAAIWQGVLDRFEPPPHGAEAADRLAPFIARRHAEGGAPALDYAHSHWSKYSPFFFAAAWTAPK